MSKFTQQHYIAIAGVLRRRKGMYLRTLVTPESLAVQAVTNDLCQLFSEDNPKFSSEKFKKAVG
jgi:hypothetical protein